MKLALSIYLIFSIGIVTAQKGDPLRGDWIRVAAEYSDGSSLPSNHHARTYQRYVFEANRLYLVNGTMSEITDYSVVGGTLKFGPVQQFRVERNEKNSLVILEPSSPLPVRHYLIPTDSFTISRKARYNYQLINSDTVYTSAAGIEPIFKQGSSEFMRSLHQGLSTFGSGAFKFTYVVRKDGSIGDVEVQDSLNEKMNKKLIQMIKKTSGSWIPGRIGNNPIYVIVSDNFRMSNRVR